MTDTKWKSIQFVDFNCVLERVKGKNNLYKKEMSLTRSALGSSY